MWKLRKELETELSPSKEFTANVGSTYASHLEDIILERANIFFRQLRSFLGDNKDETVVIGLKKKVLQNVNSWDRNFIKKCDAAKVLQTMVKELLADNNAVPSYNPIPGSIVVGSGQLMFTYDSTFPESTAGPTFEYFSNLQRHIFCSPARGQGKGIDAEHDNRNSLLNVSRRGIFFTDRLWLQQDNMSFFSPSPFSRGQWSK